MTDEPAEPRFSPTAIRLSAMLRDPRTTSGAVAEISAAIKAEGGNLVHAAKRLTVSHRALSRWINDYPQIAPALEKARAAGAPKRKTRKPAP